ncbi:hypothetical protein GCM10027446_28450 [Angustibacter peucedani]
MILGRISLITAATAASLALLTACQGDDGATAPPSPVTPTVVGTATGTASSPTSGAPSPTASTGEVPAAARANTAAGAEAFARYYFDRMNQALVEPETTDLAGLSAKTCSSCANLERNIALFRQDGEHLSAEPYLVTDFVELPESTTAHRAFQFALRQRKTYVLDRAGRRGRVQPEERHLAEVLLDRTDAGWVTADLALAALSGEGS